LNNIRKIRGALPGHGIGAMMVTDPASRLYATGFESSDGVLLVTAVEAWFYTDSR